MGMVMKDLLKEFNLYYCCYPELEEIGIATHPLCINLKDFIWLSQWIIHE